MFGIKRKLQNTKGHFNVKSQSATSIAAICFNDKTNFGRIQTVYTRANGIFAYLLIESLYFLILQKFSLIILTVCLIRIPSMIVDILFKEISLTKTASITEVVELVAKWKAIWLAICDLVIDSEQFHRMASLPISEFFAFVMLNCFILFRFMVTDHHNYSFNGIQPSFEVLH